MPLSENDLRQIDEAARLARRREKLSALARPEQPAVFENMPGPLNLQRAFFMLAHLGFGTVSLVEATAALRNNWPEKWRINEQGERFQDKWFEVMATIVRQEWEGRWRTDPAKPEEGFGNERRRDP